MIDFKLTETGTISEVNLPPTIEIAPYGSLSLHRRELYAEHKDDYWVQLNDFVGLDAKLTKSNLCTRIGIIKIPVYSSRLRRSVHGNKKRFDDEYLWIQRLRTEQQPTINIAREMFDILAHAETFRKFHELFFSGNRPANFRNFRDYDGSYRLDRSTNYYELRTTADNEAIPDINRNLQDVREHATNLKLILNEEKIKDNIEEIVVDYEARQKKRLGIYEHKETPQEAQVRYASFMQIIRERCKGREDILFWLSQMKSPFETLKDYGEELT